MLMFPLFKHLDWLPIESRLVHITLKMVHKIINNRAPSYFNALFPRLNEQHCYNSSLVDIILCHFKTMYGRKSFKYSGVQVWNKLCASVPVTGSLCLTSRTTFVLSLMNWVYFTIFLSNKKKSIQWFSKPNKNS